MRTWSIVFIAALAACSPLTRFRTSTVVPHTSPSGWTGALAENGEVFVGGGVDASSTLLGDPVLWQTDGLILDADKGDPGLLITRWGGFAHVRGAVSDHVEIGARASLYDRANPFPTRPGVLEVPGAPTGSIGITGGAQYRFGELAVIGRAEAALLWLPYARYELIDPSMEGEDVVGDASDLYRMFESDTARPLRLSGSVAMGWLDPKGRGDAHLGLALQPQFTNQGFSDEPVDPVEGGDPALLLVMGGAVDAGDLRVGLQGWGRLVGPRDYGAAMPVAGVQLMVEGRVARLAKDEGE